MTTAKRIICVLLSAAVLFGALSAFACAEETQQGEYFLTGDYSIHYTVKSAEGGFKGRILFIHGFLYSGSTWDSAARIMAQNGYDCYLVDLPGFGYSTRETQETSLIDREDILIEFMQTIAPLEQWIVAGHSMGGGVAMNIACAHPEIKSLLLFCPSEVSTNGSTMLKKMAGSKIVSKLMDAVFGAVLRSDFIVKAAVYLTCGDFEYAKNYDAKLLSEPLMIPGTGSAMLLAAANARNTDMQALAAVDTPTLLVWANGDSVINDTMRTNISAALADETIVTVDGSHIVIETAPELIAQTALDFLG